MSETAAAVRAAVRKIRARSLPGSSTESGKLYARIPWDGLGEFPAHRGNTEARVRQIAERLNVRGKTVLDLGCGSGAISLGLARAGAEVLGVDRDPQAIEVARAAAKHLRLARHRVRFEQGEISRRWARTFAGADVVVWLSSWMWIRKEQGKPEALELLYEISRRARALAFESAAADGEAGVRGLTQADIRDVISSAAVHRKLSSAKSPGNWQGGRRRVFFLEDPQLRWRGDTAEVGRLDRTRVLKTFRPGFELHADREAEALRRLAPHPNFPRLIDRDGPRGLVIEFAGWRREVTGPMVAVQAPKILGALTGADIRHRDIRPSNLLALNGELKVIDFGWCLLDEEKGGGEPKQLNDREDGAGKWGGPQYNDRQALAEVARWMQEQERAKR